LTSTPLYVLHGHDELRDGARDLSGRYDVRFVESWERLLEEVPTGGHGATLIVDPYLEARESAPAEPLFTLRREYPSSVVLAAIAPESFRVGQVRLLSELGVAEILRIGFDSTPYRLERRIETARERSGLMAVLTNLPDGIPPRTRVILEAAIATVTVGGGAPELARALYVSGRTLQRRCFRADLPPPRSLLALLRVVLAARYLDDPGRTVLSSALAAGYASDTSLNRAFRRERLPAPSTLRRGTALAKAVRAFLERVGLAH